MARTAPKPVSEANLNNAVTEMIDFYKTQDAAIQHVRDVVEFKNAIAVDDKYKTTGFVVRDPTATDHILSMGMMLTVNRPKLQLKYEGDSEAKQKLVSKLEPALESLILDDAGHKGSTYQMVGLSLAQDGGAWSSMVADLDAWKGPGSRYSIKRKDYADDETYPNSGKSGDQKYVEATDEAKRRSRCVLQWTHRDSKTVYPVWMDPNTLGAIFVVTEHPKWSTLAEYGLTLDYEGNLVDVAVGQAVPEHTPIVGEKVRKVEHWTAKSVTYFITAGKSTRRVDGWDHNYGFIPFAYTFGWRLPHWGNIKVGWGAAGVMLTSVEYLSYLKTLEANLAAAAIAPAYKRTVPIGGDPVRNPNTGKTLPTTELMPNTVLNLQPGEDILPVQQAPPNPQLRDQIAYEQEKIAELRGPVASGNLNDAQNGFAIESVKSDRRVKAHAFISGLQDHLEQVTEMAIKLIRGKIKETVWVRPRGDKASGWMSISAEMLKDQPLVNWDVSPEQPSGAIVESRYWNERLSAGTAGPDQAIEAQGDNPQDVYEDQMRAKIRQDPVVYQLHLQEVFAEYARGDLLERYNAAQQQAMTGMVPPMGGGGAMGLGEGGVPGDFGSMTMAPGGQGAQPISPMAAGIAGPAPGAPSMGAGFSPNGATASIQSLGT